MASSGIDISMDIFYLRNIGLALASAFAARNDGK